VTPVFVNPYKCVLHGLFGLPILLLLPFGVQFVTGWATAYIAITDHPLPHAKFHANQWIFGVSGPKKRKIAKISNFFAQQVRTPYPMLVKSVGFMRIIGLQKLVRFSAIRLVN